MAFSFAMVSSSLECLFIIAMMALLVMSYYLKILVYSNGAFATTFVTHGLIFGESIKKKGKKGEILKRCQKTMGCPISLGSTYGRSYSQNPHGALQGLFHG